MPKITINERDYTTAVASGISESIVYVPGLVGEKTTISDGETSTNKVELDVGTIILFRTVEEFTNTIGNAPQTIDEKFDASYIYAYELLSQGLPVLYEVVESAENIDYTKLQDRGLYDIRFLTSGGFVLTEEKIGELIKCAYTRGDCIALVDHTKSATVEEIETFYNSLTSVQGTKKAAGFTPWCTFNTSQGVQTLPGSFAYLKAYANSTVYNGNPIWYATSGSSRGVIPNIIKPLIEYGDVDIQKFQSRTSNAIAINPICNIRPFGYIVWGNRTLSPVGKTSASQETDLVASNFLNIAHTVCEINKALYDLSRRLTFEQNNDVLWATFNSRIALVLDQIKSGNGISGYRVIRVNSTKRATLEARIRIVPIEAVEDFELTIELSDTLTVVE